MVLKIIKEDTSDALILNKDSKITVASQIARNIEGEYDAIEDYYKLIPFLELYHDEEAIGHVREIISDEKNHAMLLRNILFRYDGDIPVSKD